MLQQKKADDFVLATGEQHTVREFVEEAFKCINKEITWKGEGINEVGKEKGSDRILVKVSKEFFRPIEAENFLGDYSKAKRVLGWEPKTKFEDLVKIMVKNDINELKIK